MISGERTYILPDGSDPPVRIEFENEPEPIDLSPITLRQKIALWRIIIRARLRVMLGLPPYREHTPGS